MRATLLLRLAAPLQSWGVSSKFGQRTTASEPTKSGVVGLLASAIGRGRDESIEDLASLKFGVRIDQPGSVIQDYQVAQYIVDTAEKPYGSDVISAKSHVTERFYLADAVFLVAVEGDSVLIEKLKEAVESPAYPLFLGRRSCPPTGKVCLGVSDNSLEHVLSTFEWQASAWYKERKLRKASPDSKVLLVIESSDHKGQLCRDVPVSYSWKHRQHSFRYTEGASVRLEDICAGYTAKKAAIAEHDAFELFDGSEVVSDTHVELPEHDVFAGLGGAV